MIGRILFFFVLLLLLPARALGFPRKPRPSSDPCYCTDASDPNRGERDQVLVIP